MIDDYRRGLWRGRLQGGLAFTVASLLGLGLLTRVANRDYEPETRTGYFTALNNDINRDGIDDWSFRLYNERGEPLWGGTFLGRQDGSYILSEEPNRPYRELNPPERLKRADRKDKLV